MVSKKNPLKEAIFAPNGELSDEQLDLIVKHYEKIYHAINVQLLTMPLTYSAMLRDQDGKIYINIDFLGSECLS